MTLNSLLLALTFLDLGIGNGVLNATSESYGINSKKNAQQVVSTGFIQLLVISFIYILLLLLSMPIINYANLFKISDEITRTQLTSIFLLSASLICLQIPFLLTQKVLAAYQELSTANLWILLSSLTTTILIVVLPTLSNQFIWFVLAGFATPLAILILSFLHLFKFSRSWLWPQIKFFNTRTSISLLKQGGLWTWFQSISFLAISADNLIISILSGPESVGPYAAITKIYTALVIAQMLSAPLWPAYVEALNKGDFRWASRTFNRILFLFLAIGLTGAVLIITLTPTIIRAWLGEDLIPDFSTILGFGAWCLIANAFSAISSLMANSHMLKRLTMIVTIAIAVSFPLKLLLFPMLGISGLIWSTVIGYGLIFIPSIYLAKGEIAKLLNRTSAFKGVEV